MSSPVLSVMPCSRSNAAVEIRRAGECLRISKSISHCARDARSAIRLVEMTAMHSWIRDCGPTFVVNAAGEVRGIDWKFNAWGGLGGGLYFPWDQGDLVGEIRQDAWPKASIYHPR